MTGLTDKENCLKVGIEKILIDKLDEFAIKHNIEFSMEELLSSLWADDACTKRVKDCTDEELEKIFKKK